MQFYANSNGGHLPPKLSTLLLVDVSTTVFVCPSSSGEIPSPSATPQSVVHQIDVGSACSYHYRGNGQTWPVPHDYPLIVEPLINHDREGGNILFGDGRIEFLSGTEIDKHVLRGPAFLTQIHK